MSTESVNVDKELQERAT